MQASFASSDGVRAEAENSFAEFWMPFTANRSFKSSPRLLVSASGMHYRTSDDRQLLDGTSGLWCVNAGHGRRKIVEAMAEQAGQLDFAPTFQLGHPAAFKFAAELSTLMPPGLDRIFFTNSGSESVDTALKIAFAYHRARGEAGRVRLIGRERGYHGTNLGGTSVGGIIGNLRAFSVLLPGVDHLAHTYHPGAAFTKGLPPTDRDVGLELEELVDRHGSGTIAAVIVEPVAGSTGVLLPPAGYLQALREVTKRHGILLIFDEVITAFGRLGTPTAAEYFGVTPDILTMAKGLTNGTVPMGAVAVARDIHDTIVDEAPSGIEFSHGYTYSGHPVAAAAGLATLDIYREEGLFQRAADLAPAWENALHELRTARHVVDVRAIGLMAGIELAPRDGAPGARAMGVFHACFDSDLLIRVTGDIIALSPPLIVSGGQIDEIVERLRHALAAID